MLKKIKAPDFWLVVLVTFFIIAIRNSFSELLYPSLYLEDGRDLFPIFYNNHQIKDIFRFYNGYINFLSNLLAYFLTFLPLKFIPFSFAIVSHFISALAFGCLYEFTKYIYKNKAFALYVIVIIAAFPLGNLFLVGSLMFQNWSFLAILYCLVLMPLPQGRVKNLFYTILIHGLIWTNPASVIILPVCFYWFLKYRENRISYALFMLSSLIYLVVGIEHGGVDLSGMNFIFPALVERVISDGIVGPFHREQMALVGGGFFMVFSPVVFMIIAFLYFSWDVRSIKEKEILFFLIYFMIFSTIVAVLGRNLGDEFVAGVWRQRYVYVPKILFFLIFFYSAYYFLQKYVLFRGLHFFFMILFFYINLSSNFLYETPVKGAESLSKFLQKVSQANSQCQKENNEGEFMVHDRGEWAIKIKVC